LRQNVFDFTPKVAVFKYTNRSLAFSATTCLVKIDHFAGKSVRNPNLPLVQPIRMGTALLSDGLYFPLKLQLPRWQRQRCNPPYHAPKEPSREVAFRQQQPIAPGVLYRPAAGLHQPLLQAGQRPTLDPPGQRQPPPQIPQVVGNQAQPQPYVVRPKTVANQQRHLRSQPWQMWTENSKAIRLILNLNTETCGRSENCR
jgi:hypothetical protein